MADEGGNAQPSQQDRLEALTNIIVQKRDDAVTARKQSGIEEIWEYCDAAYAGGDTDLTKNRTADWIKPMTMSGVLRKAKADPESEAMIYVRMTARYVDAGASKIRELLLSPDDKSFSLQPTTVPEMVGGEVVVGTTTQPGMETAQPEAGAVMVEARAKAEKATKRIQDWMIEAKHPQEMRKVIHDAARAGTGILKAPFATRRKSMAVVKEGDITKAEVRWKIVPGERWIDLWNLFPAPDCGENIQDGSYCVERDYMTRGSLERLKGSPGYYREVIDACLKEGPDSDDQAGKVDPEKAKRLFKIWHFYGELSPEEMLAAGGFKEDDPRVNGQESVFALVTLCNKRIIRCCVAESDTGRYPYRAMPWQRRPGHWAGIGVAEQLITPQGLVNAATKVMARNAGRSAGAQVVLDPDLITPADKSWKIIGDKVWLKVPNAVMDDVSKAFKVFEIPNRTEALMKLIEYAMRLAEESTNIPLVTQGQSGKTTPDTFGGMQLQDNNANQLLRDIAANFDDYMMEPTIQGYYEWLLMDPDVPEDEKGDFKVNAHGSLALVERGIQQQTIAAMGNIQDLTSFDVDPPLWFAEWMRANHLNPENFKLTPERKQEIQKQRQGAVAPAVQAAQIRAAAQVKVKEMDGQVAGAEIAAELDRDNANLAVQREVLVLKRDLAMLDYANTNQVTLAQIKADLAKESMKQRTTKELALLGATADRLPKPPVEPPGRAEPGRSFAQ